MSEAQQPVVSSRVLSIQSHVVSGYVGNRCAVFPLQLLGYDVDFINTVQFSNHTGYPSWKGERLSGDQLLALLEGLSNNQLDADYSHLLTGYVGSSSVANAISQVLRDLRAKNPKLIYVCDPVMGDDGKLYIAPEVIDIYRTDLIPNATIITPNQFEAETLTQTTIKNQEDALNVIEKLHSMGPSIVIITSLFYGPSNEILIIASKKEGDKQTKLKLSVPKIPHYFTGTGDLFSALILGWTNIYKNAEDFVMVCEKAISTMHLVLQETQAARDVVSPNRKTELRLIQSKKHIESPTILFKAVLL